MRSRQLFAALLVGLAALSGVSRADVVTDWNNVTLDAIRAKSINPPRATRLLAMVHVAIFDAINGIDRKFEPYEVQEQARKGALKQIAAAVAAHTVLVDQHPDLSDDFDAALDVSLAQVSKGKGKRRGIQWGEYVGNRILELRADDGADLVVPYTPSGEFGFWKPTPPGFLPALLPNWPYVKPFAMNGGSQFRVVPPPAFSSDEYAQAFNEVKYLGDADSPLRTADQTQIAYFWEDGAGTVTPPGHWQVIAQQLVESPLFKVKPVDRARLFALLSIVQADGAIVSWDNKYFYDHVRPYTAITEEADDDGNDDTSADPEWVNLIPTPPFPTYTSGHSTFSGGSSKLLALFFGTDDIPFSGESPDPLRWPDELPGVVRQWNSLSQAAEEAGQSRIYGGIHWQYDNQEGLNSGRALARFVFKNYLRPLKD